MKLFINSFYEGTVIYLQEVSEFINKCAEDKLYVWVFLRIAYGICSISLIFLMSSFNGFLGFFWSSALHLFLNEIL